jgi:tRNA (guanine6-N2)-methyltransferase
MVKKTDMYIKLAHIPGLEEIVLKELKQYSDFKILKTGPGLFVIDYIDSFECIKKLKIISRAYLATKNKVYNPIYLTKHKSIVGKLIQIIFDQNPPKSFKTFSVSCAGSDSHEIKEIKSYINSEFKLMYKDEADLKIHIAKIDDEWEIGIQITPRPLSAREYRIKNMSGAIDATIASAMNMLAQVEKKHTYLNVFSGSGTLVIEASLMSKTLEKIIGFDIDKKNLSVSIQNIKAAKQIKKIEIKEANIFDKPDFGTFDIITSDLPFGMIISKNENLESLYKEFVSFSEKSLNINGSLIVFTSEFELFQTCIKDSQFKISKIYQLSQMTNAGGYIKPKIFVCEFK